MRRYARIPLVAWLTAAVALVLAVTLAGWMMLGRGGTEPEDFDSETGEVSAPVEEVVSKPASKPVAKPDAKPNARPTEKPPEKRPAPKPRPKPPGRQDQTDGKGGSSPLDNLDSLRPGAADTKTDATPTPDAK